MGELVRDVGLKYAEIGPLSIAGFVGALALLAWGLIYFWQESERPAENPVVWGFGAAFIVVLLAGIGPFLDAKQRCDDLQQMGPLEAAKAGSLDELERCNNAGL